MKQFLEKTILVQEADNPDSLIYRMLVVEAIDSTTYKIADLGVTETPVVPTIPRELRDWMNRSGFTQKSLGETLNVHQATVSYWLNGKRRIPERVKNMMRVTELGLGGRQRKLANLQAAKDKLRQAMEHLEALSELEVM